MSGSSRRLLIVGSNSIHVYNYIKLIDGYFDEILLITNKKNREYKINSIEVDFHLNLNIFSSVGKIKSAIQEYKPSVVHIHQANSYAFLTLLAMRKMKIPTVLTAWGSDVLYAPKRNFLLKKILTYNLNNANRATSDSLFVANEMKSYNKKLTIDIVSTGIENSEDNREKENIIYSNRLHNPLYNIDKIIENFNIFLKKNPSWRLVIAAVGSETEKLKRRVNELGLEDNVEFIGWVDSEVNKAMYQKAKIFASIPSSDATAISLLEAISCNCICFVSNLPANCEHILDGINGFIEQNLDKIDFNKYLKIDTKILADVNKIRKKSYFKECNKERFIALYDELFKEKM